MSRFKKRKSFYQYCELGFGIDQRLNGGEMEPRGEEFVKKFWELVGEFEKLGYAGFPQVLIQLDMKIKIPPGEEKYVWDDKLDFADFCKLSKERIGEYLSSLNKDDGAKPVRYICTGYPEVDEEGTPILTDSCQRCCYLKRSS